MGHGSSVVIRRKIHLGRETGWIGRESRQDVIRWSNKRYQDISQDVVTVEQRKESRQDVIQ